MQKSSSYLSDSQNGDCKAVSHQHKYVSQVDMDDSCFFTNKMKITLWTKQQQQTPTKTDPPHSDASRQSACYHPPRTPAQAAYSRRRHRNRHWQWNREAPSTTATHYVSAYRSVPLHASMVLLHCAVWAWLRKPPDLRYRRVKMHEILWFCVVPQIACWNTHFCIHAW